MLKIVHSQRTRSARVIWLLEELGVPYELETVAFTPEALRSEAYLARHPMGQVPVLYDGDVTMIESGAMLQYLLERHGEGRLEPPHGAGADAAERARYLQFFHFGEATLARHTSEVVRHRFTLPEAERLPAAAEDNRRRLHAAVRFVDRELDGRPFIVGDAFTAADIMVSYGIIMARIVRELPQDLRNVPAYLARLKARPAYDKAWA